MLCNIYFYLGYHYNWHVIEINVIEDSYVNIL